MDNETQFLLDICIAILIILAIFYFKNKKFKAKNIWKR